MNKNLDLAANGHAAQPPAEEVPSSAASAAYLTLLGILALVGILAVLLPFIGPIVLAVSLSITVYPLYRRMGRSWPRMSPTVCALVIDLMILMLFVLPVFFLIWTAIAQADNLRPVLARWYHANQAIHQGRMDGSLSVVKPIQDTIARDSGMRRTEAATCLLRYAARVLDQITDWAAQEASRFLQGTLSLLLCPLITFFLLRDGRAYMERLNKLLPLHAEDRQRLFDRTRLATVAIVRGLFLTALLQSAIATLGYALMGIPSAVLLGVITGFASAIPVVGTGAVWVPVGLVTIASGRMIPGVFLLAWGAGMCLWVDSFARPWLVGHRIHMGLLPLMFGILGGVAVFGLKGLLMGPLIVSIAPTVFEIIRYRVFDLESHEK